MELLTPRGRAGVSVLRAAPSERASLLATLSTRSGVRFATEPEAPPKRAIWSLPRGIQDDVLVIDRGLHGIEVHAHGSLLLLAAVESAFGELTESAAKPADRLLRCSLSREQMLLALEQRSLDFDAWIASLSSLSESDRKRELRAALERSRISMALAMPARIVLAGRQNSGKSTLFNRLVFSERALAGPVAGLTRDAVVETTTLSGYPYELVDTAGEADDAIGIDRAAILRARGERDRADAIVLVVDGSRPAEAIDLQIAAMGAIVVATKADLPQCEWPDVLVPSLRLVARDPDQAPSIREAVGDLLRRRRQLPSAGPVGGPAAIDEGQHDALRMFASAQGVAPA